MNGFHLRLEKAPAFFPPKYIPWSKRKHAIAKETASGQEHVRTADFSLRVFLLNLFSLSDTEGESSWTHSHSLQAWPSVMEPHLQGQPTKPGLGAVTCPRAKAPWASPFPFAALPGLTDNLNTGPWASTVWEWALIPGEVFWALFSIWKTALDGGLSQQIPTALVLSAFFNVLRKN